MRGRPCPNRTARPHRASPRCPPAMRLCPMPCARPGWRPRPPDVARQRSGHAGAGSDPGRARPQRGGPRPGAGQRTSPPCSPPASGAWSASPPSPMPIDGEMVRPGRRGIRPAAGGRRRLGFADGSERALAPGDWAVIPARCRHRVAWTDPAGETLWLAVHPRRFRPVDPAQRPPGPAGARVPGMSQTVPLSYALANLPRYTSYRPRRISRRWRKPVSRLARCHRPTDRLSLYVHIPFCRALCWYCGCHTR